MGRKCPTQFYKESDDGESVFVLDCFFQVQHSILVVHVHNVQLGGERLAIQRMFRAPAVARPLKNPREEQNYSWAQLVHAYSILYNVPSAGEIGGNQSLPLVVHQTALQI